MNVIIIIFIVLGILIAANMWGKSEKAQKRRRASAVVIPDVPLNDIRVSSGVAELILSGQFENDISMYRFYFNQFLTVHLIDDIKGRMDSGEKDYIDTVKDIYIEYGNHAVVKGSKNDKNWPNSFATLLKADNIDGEAGVNTRNAMIYSIAMCCVSTTQTTWMKNIIQGASMAVGAGDTMTQGEYDEYMRSNHPRAAAIAESSGHIESEEVARKVVSMMGYFIDKAQTGGPNETERERGLRILDEQELTDILGPIKDSLKKLSS